MKLQSKGTGRAVKTRKTNVCHLQQTLYTTGYAKLQIFLLLFQFVSGFQRLLEGS